MNQYAFLKIVYKIPLYTIYPIVARALGLAECVARAKVFCIQKIPYRRARAWPLGRVRAKLSCIQAFLNKN